MAIVAHWEDAEGVAGTPRRPRRKLQLEARSALASGGSAEILVHDISATGLLLESPVELASGEAMTIDLPQAAGTRAKVVWNSGRLYGCQFDEPISSAALSAAQLRSAVGQPVDIAHQRGASSTDASFGARLQRLRKTRGISQAHVASRLGVSKPTVWAWEHDKARPVGSRIEDLADVLGVGSAELLAGGGTSEAESLVARSRERLAAAFGTSPEKVKIWVEL